MTIWHVFSLELLVAVILMLTYAFFNDYFVKFERWVGKIVRKVVKK